MDEKEFGTFRRGRAASAAEALLGPEIEKLTKQVDQRIFEKLRKGEPLDPNEAVQAWLEKYAYKRVISSLERTEKAGLSASQRLTPHMEMP